MRCSRLRHTLGVYHPVLARMDAASLEYHDWLRGWKSWASNRKRGKLAQFIVELLETQNGAK